MEPIAFKLKEEEFLSKRGICKSKTLYEHEEAIAEAVEWQWQRRYISQRGGGKSGEVAEAVAVAVAYQNSSAVK